MKASERDYLTVAGVRREKMEKQIGCMSGFLQIFDRQQILAGKRIHSPKRLPPSTGVGASPEESSGNSQSSPAEKMNDRSKSPPEKMNDRSKSPAKMNNRSKSPAEKMNDRSKSPAEKMNYRSKSPPEKMNGRSKSPVTENSSWKSYKEIHRHSLDSRITVTASNTAVIDGDDNQRRSPSVIARLMGLEPLSSSDQQPPLTVSKPALRRSVSELRVSRDLIHSKYIDDNNFQLKQPNKSESVKRIVRDDRSNANYVSNRETANCRACKSMKSESSRTSPWRSRSFFDSTELFPEPNQRTVTMHEGIDEQTNDLSTLKQILEVLQLKGLLRSNGDNHRNFVYDRNLRFNESDIILVKPSRSSASKSDYHRSVTDSRRTRRFSENSPAISPKRDGGAVDRSGRIPARVRTCSPNRIESNLKACNSISKTKTQSIDLNKLTPKRNGSVHHSSINRSPRNQKLTELSSINPLKQKFIKNIVTEDESSSISESIFSTPSTTDSERSKWEGCREGTSSLQRCDTESPPSSTVVLPSPVSVLDSEFDKDEPSSCSHGFDLKATPAVDFRDHKLPPTKSTELKEFKSDDPNFIYISEIIQASQHLPEDSNAFFSIEKQFYNTENTSNVSKHQRKLIFDVVLEIIERNRQLPPWKQLIDDSRPSIKQIWSEFQKIREINRSGDGVLELVNGVIEKDVVEINDWRDYSIATSEVVLDIERLIFKDLVGEVIRDVVELFGECVFFSTRKKLVFSKFENYTSVRLLKF